MLKIWLRRHLKQIGIACIILSAILFYLALAISCEPAILSVSETGVLLQQGGGFKWGLVALCIVFLCSGGLVIYKYAKERRERDRQALDNAFNKMIRKR